MRVLIPAPGQSAPQAFRRPFRRPAQWLTVIAWAALAASCPAQQGGADPLHAPPRQWAAEAADNEVKLMDYGHNYLRYRMHSRDDHGDRVRDMIQSRDGTVARMILKEGRPLTPEEDADERGRLQEMLDSPGAFAKHIKGDASGKKMGADLIREMPNAMLYTYVQGQPQRPGHAGDTPDVVVDFEPDPAWRSPSITADMLLGLKGRLWIDPRTRVLTRMDATIFRPVNVAGFLAHIFPGGKLEFEQSRVTEQRWMFSRFVERLDVRILFKTIKQNSNMEGSDFKPVPEMGYQEAVRMLMATPLPKS